jgi:DNA repair protein RadC
MKTQKQIICENAETYGFISQSNTDLLKLLNYKLDESSFYNSIQYKAFKELTRRKKTEAIVKITNSQQIQQEMAFLEGYAHEEFWAIYLKRNNTIISKIQHSKGGISGTIVDVRLILKEAILNKASGIILVHNHPSGELKPSEEDKQITSRIKQSAKIMDMLILDHIIIGNNNQYFSFNDEGLMY